MRMLSRMHQGRVEMCGSEQTLIELAAYSQTFSGLAEGLSNYNATPVGYPRPHGLIWQDS